MSRLKAKRESPSLLTFASEPSAFLGNVSYIRPAGLGGNQLGFAIPGVSSRFLSLLISRAQGANIPRIMMQSGKLEIHLAETRATQVVHRQGVLVHRFSPAGAASRVPVALQVTATPGDPGFRIPTNVTAGRELETMEIASSGASVTGC